MFGDDDATFHDDEPLLAQDSAILPLLYTPQFLTIKATWTQPLPEPSLTGRPLARKQAALSSRESHTDRGAEGASTSRSHTLNGTTLLTTSIRATTPRPRAEADLTKQRMLWPLLTRTPTPQED